MTRKEDNRSLQGTNFAVSGLHDKIISHGLVLVPRDLSWVFFIRCNVILLLCDLPAQAKQPILVLSPFRSQTKQELAPPLHVVERYIELLCRYKPEEVYMFLKSSDNYRLEEALEVRHR